MRPLEAVAIGLIVLLALVFALFGRRELLSRAHRTVAMHVRLHQWPRGGGWAIGFAQFRGDELWWYRLFSLFPRPRRRVSRRSLKVDSRREPTPDESKLIPVGWMVVRCTTGQGFVEFAMPRHTFTGFLSWVESSPRIQGG